jgi:hypothetical protein
MGRAAIEGLDVNEIPCPESFPQMIKRDI